MSLVARFAVLACLVLPPGLQAATCSRESPAHTVALIELYTSEGCSSCPPADRWLSELTRRFPAEQLVPLALHVDYWDYIGWQDPFAQPMFAERQQWLSRLASGSTVYTPEVFSGMKEVRDWRNPAGFAEKIQAINRQPARATIALHMQTAGADRVELQVRFTAGKPGRELQKPQNLQGTLVVYEDHLGSAVRAGENRGATLQHEHVVRYWSAPVVLDAASGVGTLHQIVSLPAAWKRANLGVAAFVQDSRAGEVLQAVSMPGCV